MGGGGQPIPAGLSCPPTWIFEQWLAMDSKLLLIAVTTINGYVSQNTETACLYTKNHFLKFIHLLVGGNISQLVYLTPPPKILEQWLFTHNEMTLMYYIT